MLVALTGGELLWRNAASSLNAEPADRYAVFQKLPPEQLQGLQLLKAELAARHAQGERPRVEILGLGGAWQNASMVLGLEDTLGYNPLRLSDYERAVGPGENAVDPNLRKFPGTFRGYKCRLAGLLGLEYLVLDRPIERLPPHFPRFGDAKLLYGSGRCGSIAWPRAPRAYLATHLIPVDSESVLEQEELPEFDRAHAALIEQDAAPASRATTAPATAPRTPIQPTAPRRSREYGRNAVTLEVETDRDSVLVLHDIFYPGWEAYVDGQRRPILRANLLFRGVEVSPGRHRIEFRFRPLSIDNLSSAAADLDEQERGRRSGDGRLGDGAAGPSAHEHLRMIPPRSRWPAASSCQGRRHRAGSGDAGAGRSAAARAGRGGVAVPQRRLCGRSEADPLRPCLARVRRQRRRQPAGRGRPSRPKRPRLRFRPAPTSSMPHTGSRARRSG